jgi:hypothetical protein
MYIPIECSPNDQIPPKHFVSINSTNIYIPSDKFVLQKSISMELPFNTFPLSSWCDSILKNFQKIWAIAHLRGVFKKKCLSVTSPDIQIIPLNIPGMKTAGKNQKALAMGLSVPSKYRSLLNYIYQTISEDMKVEYVDFTMKHDLQKKILY